MAIETTMARKREVYMWCRIFGPKYGRLFYARESLYWSAALRTKLKLWNLGIFHFLGILGVLVFLRVLVGIFLEFLGFFRIFGILGILGVFGISRSSWKFGRSPTRFSWSTI